MKASLFYTPNGAMLGTVTRLVLVLSFCAVAKAERITTQRERAATVKVRHHGARYIDNGTGVFVAPHFIVSCAHVLGPGKLEIVSNQGRSYSATVLTQDKTVDVSCLHVSLPKNHDLGQGVHFHRDYSLDLEIGGSYEVLGYPGEYNGIQMRIEGTRNNASPVGAWWPGSGWLNSGASGGGAFAKHSDGKVYLIGIQSGGRGRMGVFASPTAIKNVLQRAERSKDTQLVCTSSG